MLSMLLGEEKFEGAYVSHAPTVSNTSETDETVIQILSWLSLEFYIMLYSKEIRHTRHLILLPPLPDRVCCMRYCDRPIGCL
jgi:hypothetical protein